MLYKLIDNSTGEHLWIWIADITNNHVKILYGKDHISDDSRWSPFEPANTATDSWHDWSNWESETWIRVPLSHEEFFAVML